MIGRIWIAFWAILKASNIWACTFVVSCLYIFLLADKPTGRMFTSSYVGRALANGHRWAVPAAAVIDWLAIHLAGDRPDHCLRAYRHYLGKDS